jgi:hypothetical protein
MGPSPVYPPPGGAATRDSAVLCPCGRRVKRRSRAQKFCSDKCRQRARREKTVRDGGQKIGQGGSTRPVTNPPKNCRVFNGLQGAKSRTSPSISGPDYVLDFEIFEGREWAAVTSPDGVTCTVSSLRSPPLRRAA